jgi:hypothetical protein
MTAYELLLFDKIKVYKVVGVLPERRKNLARITQKSVRNWGEKYFGNKFDINEIFFFRITIDENVGGIFQPTPLTIT